jgi:hypothetical protein
MGFVVSAVFPMLGDGGRNLLMNTLIAGHFLLLPFLAGYFTAKYASNRPQLHVLLVTVVGYLFLLRLTFQGDPIWGHIIKVAALVATASLGAFIVLRSRRHEI